MNKHIVRIEETLSRDVTITAKDEREAIDKVRDIYDRRLVILDNEDLVDTDITNIGTTGGDKDE